MKFVTYESSGACAEITISRQEKRNALNRDVVLELQQTIERAEEDNSVRVIVLTGSGAVFSAGADLQALQHLRVATPMENLTDSQDLATLFESIYRCPKPIIAKVNGHAIAGGCGLASICDFSIASETAKLGFTEVRIGFVPAIVMVFIIRKIGEVAARNLFLRGHLITAEEAYSIGLISNVVPAEELDSAVKDLVEELATQTSASAVALTKKLMADLHGIGLTESLGIAVNMNAFARGTADCQAGIDAFLSKKPMPWSSD